jgi:hypothetical protein
MTMPCDSEFKVESPEQDRDNVDVRKVESRNRKSFWVWYRKSFHHRHPTDKSLSKDRNSKAINQTVRTIKPFQGAGIVVPCSSVQNTQDAPLLSKASCILFAEVVSIIFPVLVLSWIDSS